MKRRLFVFCAAAVLGLASLGCSDSGDSDQGTVGQPAAAPPAATDDGSGTKPAPSGAEPDEARGTSGSGSR